MTNCGRPKRGLSALRLKFLFLSRPLNTKKLSVLFRGSDCRWNYIDLEFLHVAGFIDIVAVCSDKSDSVGTRFSEGVLVGIKIVLDILDHKSLIRLGDIECLRDREQPSVTVMLDFISHPMCRPGF